MRDHSRAAARVRSARLGGAEFGEGTVVIDEDALVFLLGSADEQTSRVRLSSIRRIGVDGDQLSITLTDESSLALSTDAPDELHALLLDACRALPELTRGLRSFGSQRRTRVSRPSHADEQQRFFAPLLEARREAEDAGTPAAVIGAFDARRLRRSLDAALHAFSQARASDNPPARRALEAELTDAADPFATALEALDRTARNARSALDDIARWRAWSASLVAMFEAADRSWTAVDGALESPSVFRDVAPVPPWTRRA